MINTTQVITAWGTENASFQKTDRNRKVYYKRVITLKVCSTTAAFAIVAAVHNAAMSSASSLAARAMIS